MLALKCCFVEQGLMHGPQSLLKPNILTVKLLDSYFVFGDRTTISEVIIRWKLCKQTFLYKHVPHETTVSITIEYASCLVERCEIRFYEESRFYLRQRVNKKAHLFLRTDPINYSSFFRNKLFQQYASILMIHIQYRRSLL